MQDWIIQIVENMGYIGLALLTFLENVFPPIPSEVILPLGGFLASQGELNLLGVILAGVAGSVAGAIPLYYLGRFFDKDRIEKWVDDHGHWVLLTRSDIRGAFSWFDKHENKAVFFCRLIPGVRSLISIPAGSVHMDMGPFLLYTALGTGLWAALLAFIGMQLGEQYESLSRFLSLATYVVIGLIVISIVWWIIQKRREKTTDRGQATQVGEEG